MHVGKVRDIVNMQLERWEADELLRALGHRQNMSPTLATLETRLIEILYPDHAA